MNVEEKMYVVSNFSSTDPRCDQWLKNESTMNLRRPLTNLMEFLLNQVDLEITLIIDYGRREKHSLTISIVCRTIIDRTLNRISCDIIDEITKSHTPLTMVCFTKNSCCLPLTMIHFHDTVWIIPQKNFFVLRHVQVR